MKKIFALAMSAALILSGCSSNAPTNPAVSGSSVSTASSSGEYNFTIGTSATKDSTIGQTMQYAANLITERTDGRITVTCYPDSQLGSDSELVEGVQLGSITMVIGNTAPQVTFVPDLALFDLPNTYLLPFHYGTYDCPTVAAHCGEPEDIYPYITNSLQRGLILAPGEPFVVPFKYSAKSSS